MTDKKINSPYDGSDVSWEVYNEMQGGLVKNLDLKNADIMDLTFSDVGRVNSYSFSMWNKNCPLREDKEGKKYVTIGNKRYYDYNDVKNDQQKQKHIFRATARTLFLWEALEGANMRSWVYMMIKEIDRSYDNYQARMKGGKVEFLLWKFIKSIPTQGHRKWKVWKSEEVEQSDKIEITPELIKKFLEGEVTPEENQAILEAAEKDHWLDEILNSSI